MRVGVIQNRNDIAMKDDVILKIENVSKQYRLGTIGTGTISHDFNRFLAKIRGKEDPFLKIGESNDRSKKGESEYVWALKDINFEVKRGEILGIIGKNGAGKSTLLKILSKVTGPTTGSIKSKGRIASLLEVGTGFHPEMTGKENIFLNGAILGMTKKEISLKLEEIVDFSGCERYIDTPVKRYSSGMKVRLAFAVAAFLEPDILVVDEVLAVGDAEFQKKAIGKMQDISSQGGRTVLFVSHDMGAIKSLCNRIIVLEHGKTTFSGGPIKAVNYYLSTNKDNFGYLIKVLKDTKQVKLLSYDVLLEGDKIESGSTLSLGDKLKFILDITTIEVIEDFCISMNVMDDMENLISHISHEDDNIKLDKEKLTVEITTNELLYVPGFYKFSIWFGVSQKKTLLDIDNFFVFDLVKGNMSKRKGQIPAHSRFYLPTKWKVND
jgi:lipopolysaccharide transport system ATP-binding protein